MQVYMTCPRCGSSRLQKIGKKPTLMLALFLVLAGVGLKDVSMLFLIFSVLGVALLVIALISRMKPRYICHNCSYTWERG